MTVALRHLDFERIPQTAILAAVLFVASLITVPVGPSSVHLILSGLMGLILGWSSVPAILVALTLQAVFFGYGGLLVLGVNTMNLALPALLISLIFSKVVVHATGKRTFWLSAMAGALAAALSGLLVTITIALSDPAFVPAAKVILITYAPLVIAEGAVTATAVTFIKKVAPEMLIPVGAQHG